MSRLTSLCALILCCLALQGCAIYSTASDERLTGTMSDDTAISTAIKKDLMSESVGAGWDIAVYSYYGHVFLVGECPTNMRSRAVSIAKKRKDALSVTSHWFERRAGGDSDTVLTGKVWASLIGASDVNSTRINMQVNANRVVLLGVAKDAGERKRAVRAARGVENVNTVTSYIMLPMKPGVAFTPTGITYQGLHPKKRGGSDGAEKGRSDKSPSEAETGAQEVDYGDDSIPSTAPEAGGGSGGGVQGRDI